MFIGDGAKLVRDAFALAKEKSPAIIFIDELDAIGTKVGSKSLLFFNGVYYICDLCLRCLIDVFFLSFLDNRDLTVKRQETER